MEFVRTHGVVGLAVGLAIGAQVGVTINVIVKEFINPFVGFVLGNTQTLETAQWHITVGHRIMIIGWGAILTSLISLVAIMIVIYYTVHWLRLDKLDAKKEE